VAQLFLSFDAAVPIAPASTVRVSTQTWCATVFHFQRPALFVTADNTKLYCPVLFGGALASRAPAIGTPAPGASTGLRR